ncbi:hypothetical protein TELCIR_25385 [Teladorsagia circumcincta]|uniref:Uncharacterized protein n=1 Tax=Teladorsagia circumcincta TaxID=45464 RepID=A0A2G9T5N3_TELCI|nr:hypothetical protein TELCIR_25385 [Teladorsagia circumcincta]
MSLLGCTRGAPEYESRMSFHEETPITGCSQSTTCSNNYECKSVGSSQWCCPSVASVCGPIGGRPLDTSIYSRGSVYHNGVEKQPLGNALRSRTLEQQGTTTTSSPESIANCTVPDVRFYLLHVFVSGNYLDFYLSFFFYLSSSCCIEMNPPE